MLLVAQHLVCVGPTYYYLLMKMKVHVHVAKRTYGVFVFDSHNYSTANTASSCGNADSHVVTRRRFVGHSDCGHIAWHYTVASDQNYGLAF
jgi:hypothetical protein